MITKEEFQQNFPYITCIRTNGKEYLGIFINSDHLVASIYDLNMIIDKDLRECFLQLGETWWWESNRKIPINIFLKNEMTEFRCYIKTFNIKDIEVVFGPVVNLNDIAEKRIKRKSIQLIRTLKKTHN